MAIPAAALLPQIGWKATVGVAFAAGMIATTLSHTADADGDRLSVLQPHVRFDNERISSLITLLRESPADTVTVQEATDKTARKA
ncbi:hypothetical protein [Hoeflea sp.]|uniref:hypothetical protein n=1 Tax=Hoeflea sp. TaxID=1940281 RepID=UPI003BB21BF5